jgi:hypothetical protein
MISNSRALCMPFSRKIIEQFLMMPFVTLCIGMPEVILLFASFFYFQEKEEIYCHLHTCIRISFSPLKILIKNVILHDCSLVVSSGAVWESNP